MEMEGYVISGIKVVNIFEENALVLRRWLIKWSVIFIQKYSLFKYRRQYYPSTRWKRI